MGEVIKSMELRDIGFKVGTHKGHHAWKKKVLGALDLDALGQWVWSAFHEQAASNLLSPHLGRGKHSSVMTECAKKRLTKNSLAQLWPRRLTANWDYPKWVSTEKTGVLSHRRPSNHPISLFEKLQRIKT